MSSVVTRQQKKNQETSEKLIKKSQAEENTALKQEMALMKNKFNVEVKMLKDEVTRVTQERDTAQKQANAAQKQADEERRKREAVEEKFARQNIFQFLDVFDNHLSKMSVEDNAKLSTGGVVSDAVGRLYPKKFCQSSMPPSIKILPELVKILSENKTMKSAPELAVLFDTTNKISSEVQLVNFLTNNVNYPIVEVIKSFRDFEASKTLKIPDAHYQEHRNLGKDYEKPYLPKFIDGKNGKSEQADDFLIYKKGGATKIALCAEYKAPHKLPLDGILNVLKGEIKLDQKRIDAKEPIILVLVQLFSSMMKTNVKHGYVSTGKAVVFLWIEKTVETANYCLFVPGKESKETDDLSKLRLKAIGQILDFALVALKQKSELRKWWENETSKLSTWPEKK